MKLVYVAAGFLVAKALAAQGACKPMIDAEMKVFDTPTHVYTTTNVGGHIVTVESIYTGGLMYVKVNGGWSSTGTTKSMADMVQKRRQQHSDATCSYVRDEPVRGEAAALYTMNAQLSNGGKLVSQMWISKAKGLPLRQEDDIESGGSGRKTHNATRYEYANVKAPM